MSLSTLLKEIKGTSKPAEKQAILLSHDSDMLRWVIESTYNPFAMYHIKIKEQDIPEPGPFSFEEIYNKVTSVIVDCLGCLSPKQNKSRVLELLALLDKGSQDLVVGILNKSWQSGISSKLILEAYPGIFPIFEVQLANTYSPDKKYKNSKWIVSPKLDGLRNIALRLDGSWKMLSRKGHEFVTVDYIKEDLEFLYNKYGYTFFDGELYKHGLKFEDIQGPVMSFTSGDAEGIEYHVFVVGQAEDFLSQKNKSIVVANWTIEETKFIKPVEQRVISNEHVYEVLSDYFDMGYEGCMLRDPKKSYDFKRSDAIVKLKRNLNYNSEEIESDCVIKNIVVGNFPVIENGRMFTEEMLLALVVEQNNGIECKVGSGFDLKFRRTYKDKNDLIDKIVEIRHQKFGNNGRMRFPRMMRLRLDL
jgi:hypothetical protein